MIKRFRDTFQLVLLILLVLHLPIAPPTLLLAEEKNPFEVTLHLSNAHSFRYAGYYAAIQKGFYKELGIEVRLHICPPGEQVAEVTTTPGQYGVLDHRLVRYRLQGKPVVVLSPIFQHSPSVFLCRYSSAITSPHELVNHPIILSPGIQSTEFLAVFHKESIPTESVYFLDGNHNDFFRGTADVIAGQLLNEPFHLDKKNLPYSVIQPRTYGVDFYGDTLFTSTQEAENQPETARAIIKASILGWDYALQHPDEMVELIHKQYAPSTPKELLNYQSLVVPTLIRPNLVKIGHSNPGRWRQIATVYRQHSQTPLPGSLDGFLFQGSKQKVTYRYQTPILLTLVFFCFPVLLLLTRYKRKRSKQKELPQKDTISFQPTQLATLSNIAIVGYNQTGEIVFWNFGSTLLFGWTEDEVKSKYIQDVIIPRQNNEQIFSALSSLVESEDEDDFSVFCLRHKQGTPTFVQRSSMIYRQKDQVILFSFFTDLSSIKVSERKNKVLESKYFFLLEKMSEGVALFDVIVSSSSEPIDFHFTYANPAFEKITGHKITDVVGRNLSHVLLRADKRWIDRYKRLVQTEKTIKFIDHTIELDRYFEITMLLTKVNRLTCFFRDITEQKMAEEKMSYFSTLLEHVHNAVVVTTKEKEIRFWNKFASKMYGYSIEEAIGSNFDELVLPPSSAMENKKRNLLMEKTGKWEDEAIHMKKDGSGLSVHITEQLFHDEQSTIPFYLLIIEDITERNDLLKLLHKSHKLETIGNLSKGIAHDFNNILTTIIGYGEIALEDIAVDSPARSYLNEIFKAGNRAKELVSQILTFSKKHEEKLIPMDMGDIIREALILIKASAPPTIELHHRINEECGQIRGNPMQIFQVCINLCTYSLLALKESGDSLSITLDYSGPEKNKQEKKIALIISDNGPGISEMMAENLFKPGFSQRKIDMEEDTFYRGLSVVKSIIEHHKGTISVESNMDIGTTYKILFPEISRKILPPITNDDKLPGGDEKLLIVDDEPSIVNITSLILKGLGYTTYEFTDSRTAFQTFSEDPYYFDLIISDQTMPNLTGLELAEEVYKIRKDLPILICTGYAHMLEISPPNQANICNILVKPITKRKLAYGVRAALARTPIL